MQVLSSSQVGVEKSKSIQHAGRKGSQLPNSNGRPWPLGGKNVGCLIVPNHQFPQRPPNQVKSWPHPAHTSGGKSHPNGRLQEQGKRDHRT